MAVPSDENRKEQLFSSFAKSDHPAKKFAWGNLKTLKDNIEDDKLYEELHKFREKHYSAHRMTLTVQARLSLDTLEKYVVDCFSAVENNNLPAIDFQPFMGGHSFDTEDFRMLYKIKPVNDLCQIDLTWVMPSMHHLYKSKPHQYISFIIGHEGKGSLISYLRKKMWCLGITSGNSEDGFEHSSMYALFTISLVLTDEGYANLEEVLNTVFSYINMVKEKGPQKRIYDEIHQIDEVNFRFVDEVPPIENVENLCQNMHFYAPADYITGSELYFEYDPKSIENCMAALCPEKVNIMLVNKKFDDTKFDHTEPWFGTKFANEVIPKSWVETWKKIEPLPEFHLPEPNIFVATDFSLIPLDPEKEIPNFPCKVYHDALCEIWYRPDPKFRLPECYINFYLISPLVMMSPQNIAMVELFSAVLSQVFVEKVYAASVANLRYSLSPDIKGLVLKVNGLNDKLPLLLHTMMRFLVDISSHMNENLFNVLKKQQIKAYYNCLLKPSFLNRDVRMSILKQVSWTVNDKHAAIANIGFEQFVHFVKHFTDNVYIQCHVQGNMTEENVVKNIKTCVDILGCGAMLKNTMPECRIGKIPVGTHCCRVKNFNPEDLNSVVTNYYQYDTASIKLMAFVELMVTIMEEPLFNQLRTQQQLGYDVSCLLRDTFGIVGYSITVHSQANKFSTETVDDKIEEFLSSFQKFLAEMSEDEFNHFKDSLIKIKQCSDIHLRDEVKRNWGEITSNEYLFDRLAMEIAIIEEIQLQDLRDWVEKKMEVGNVRKLSIQVVGTSQKNGSVSVESNPSKPKTSLLEYGAETKYSIIYLSDLEDEKKKKPDGYYITDIEDYKRNLYLYPIVRTARN